MDERRCRYFLAVAEDESISRAAARLHLAQPSLSQAIRTLEEELGVELFHRVGRGVRLSAAGHAFVGPARAVLRAVAEAREVISDVTELRSGGLEIATLATLAVDPMAGLIGSFRERHPGVQVRVVSPEGAKDVSALVREGACELGAAHLPLRGSGLECHVLGAQQLMFVLPPGDGASHRTSSIRARKLAETPFVVGPVGTSTRALLEQALGAVGIVPQIAVETAAREAVIPLVLSGAGAALLPAGLAEQARERGAVVRPASPPIHRDVGVVHRPGRLSPPARAFLELALRTRLN